MRYNNYLTDNQKRKELLKIEQTIAGLRGNLIPLEYTTDDDRAKKLRGLKGLDRRCKIDREKWESIYQERESINNLFDEFLVPMIHDEMPLLLAYHLFLEECKKKNINSILPIDIFQEELEERNYIMLLLWEYNNTSYMVIMKDYTETLFNY